MIWMDLGDNRQEGRFEGAIAYAFVHLFSRVLYLAFSLVLGELQPFDLFDVCEWWRFFNINDDASGGERPGFGVGCTLSSYPDPANLGGQR